MMSGLVQLLRRALGISHVAAQLAELSRAADRLAATQAETLAATKEVSAATRRIEARFDESDSGLLELRETAAALHVLRRETGASAARPADQPALRRKLMLTRLAERRAAAELAPAGLADQPEELDACRAIEARCAFVMGFARSSTTVTAQVINGDPRAFIMGEANFHLPRPGCFRAAYNAQHIAYGNQVTKFSHAPDFVGRPGATWWEYLLAASGKYALVGDKLAFSSHFLVAADRARTMSFYEARFFASRYVFLFRDPVQTVLSARQLFDLRHDAAVETEIRAWLEMAMLWADWVRTFPHTLTLTAGELGPEAADRIGGFLGLQLSGARLLFNQSERRRHAEGDLPPMLARCRAELEAVYEAIQAAIAYGHDIGRPGAGPPPGFLHAPYPVGHAWDLARSLRDRLDCGTGRPRSSVPAEDLLAAGLRGPAPERQAHGHRE